MIVSRFCAALVAVFFAQGSFAAGISILNKCESSNDKKSISVNSLLKGAGDEDSWSYLLLSVNCYSHVEHGTNCFGSVVRFLSVDDPGPKGFIHTASEYAKVKSKYDPSRNKWNFNLNLTESSHKHIKPIVDLLAVDMKTGKVTFVSDDTTTYTGSCRGFSILK